MRTTLLTPLRDVRLPLAAGALSGIRVPCTTSTDTPRGDRLQASSAARNHFSSTTPSTPSL